MEARSKRNIKSAEWYKPLVPKPEGGVIVIGRSTEVKDTLKLIPRVIRETLDDTVLLAPRLRGKSLRKTAENIWNFVYEHVQYRKDRPGYEEVRRPARTLYDQVGDCDCMATLIGSLLTNLGIAYRLRVTAYFGRNYFQHIYVIVPTKKGGYITIDPVVDEFDFEEPFTAKKDIKMDLHYLNGPSVDEDGVLRDFFTGSDFAFEEEPEIMDGDSDEEGTMLSDVELLDLDEDELEGLGLFRRRRKKKKKKKEKKGGGFFKKALHAVNKFNPATALLRAGVLASMKLNVMKIAERIRFAYLDDHEARRRKFRMDRYAKLKKVREKLEKIFFAAGGKPVNLKKAVLKGKGNDPRKKGRNDHVPVPAGLKGLGQTDDPALFNEYSSLMEVLGPEIYNEEIVKPSIQNDGLSGGLGEPALGAALAAASAAMGIIAALLKKNGDVRTESDQPDINTPSTPLEKITAIATKVPSLIDAAKGLPTRDPADLPGGSAEQQQQMLLLQQLQAGQDAGGGSAPVENSGGQMNRESSDTGGDSSEDGKDGDKPKRTFGEWVSQDGWKWGLGIAAGGTLIYLGYRALSKPKNKGGGTKGLGGTKKKKRKRKSSSSKRKGKRPSLSLNRRGRSLRGTKPSRPSLSGKPGASRTSLDGAKKKRKRKSTKRRKPKSTKRSTKKRGGRKLVSLS